MGLVAIAVGLFLTFSTSSGTLTGKHDLVRTSSGLILGHVAPNRSDVTEFLGIPYGKAPIGDLRFAPPQMYNASPSHVFNASNWSPDCPNNKPPLSVVSTFDGFTPQGLRIWSNFASWVGNPVDEDCLKLNIWTKSTKKKAQNPVFVWFHGGRFTIPGPHSPFYSGQYFASAEDVVVVTVNYRLGILGFSGAPSLPQNAALRDQHLAVAWVHSNIASFGGDPSRIILFGQSAGGSSVDYFAHSSLTSSNSTPIAGLISHSGTALSFLPNTASYASQLWFNVSSTLNCGSNTTTPFSNLACMRTANITSLLAAAAVAPALPSQALSQATFHPTIDETLVFPNYTTLGLAGNFSRTPYLAGHASYEAGWYKLSAYIARRNLSASQWDLFNNRAFNCPTAYSTSLRARYGVPTWRYRYFGNWANLRLYGGNTSLSNGRDSGGYHGSEIGMVFGTAEDISGVRNEVEEDGLSRYMMRAWATFGRDPEKGLEDVLGWPRVRDEKARKKRVAECDESGEDCEDEEEETLVRLGWQNRAEPDFVRPSLYDVECPDVEVNDPLPGRGAF